MKKLKKLKAVKPVATKAVEAVPTAKTKAAAPTPRTTAPKPVSLQAVIAVLKKRIGDPMLCRFKNEGEGWAQRTVSAELKYESLSLKTVREAMHDLKVYEEVGKWLTWGATNRGSWYYADSNFRVRFEFRRYADNTVVVFCSTQFALPGKE